MKDIYLSESHFSILTLRSHNTAIVYWLESLIASFGSSKEFRTPQRGWSPEPVNSTTLHRSFENCTGFQSPSGYKIAMLVNKCLLGIAPPYLAELCRPVVHLSGRRHLRSAASRKLDVQRTAGQPQPLVAGTSLFPVRRLGTVYQLNCVCRHCPRPPLHDAWKRISNFPVIKWGLSICELNCADDNSAVVQCLRQWAFTWRTWLQFTSFLRQLLVALSAQKLVSCSWKSVASRESHPFQISYAEVHGIKVLCLAIFIHQLWQQSFS